jgi:hypothetical protein
MLWIRCLFFCLFRKFCALVQHFGKTETIGVFLPVWITFMVFPFLFFLLFLVFRLVRCQFFFRYAVGYYGNNENG